MRKIVAVLGAFLLLGLISCDSKDDIIINPPPDGPLDPLDGVRIVSPEANHLYHFSVPWIYPNPQDSCIWSMLPPPSQALTATIATELPGEMESAQVYVRAYSSSSFSPYGTELDSLTGIFLADFWRTDYSYNSLGDTIPIWFYVQVRLRDGTEWESPVKPIFVLATLEPTMSAPDAPRADTLIEYSYDGYPGGITLNARWYTCTPEIREHIVYLHNSFNGAVKSDTLPVDYVSNGYQAYFSQYLPMTTYSFWVRGVNAWGESPTSDTLRIATDLPSLPSDLSAGPYYYGDAIEVRWHNPRICDSLLVARRDSVNDWRTIVKRSGSYNGYFTYLDSDVVADTEYYYRVGIEFANGVWWGADSVSAQLED